MVTISIPLYNTQEWISRAILSVFNQTYQDFELLLIDDCGNDDTIKIASEKFDEFNVSKGAKYMVTNVKDPSTLLQLIEFGTMPNKGESTDGSYF